MTFAWSGDGVRRRLGCTGVGLNPKEEIAQLTQFAKSKTDNLNVAK